MHTAFLSLIENVNVGVAIIIVLLYNCLQYATDIKKAFSLRAKTSKQEFRTYYAQTINQQL